MIVFIISLRSWSNSLCLWTAFDCSSTVHGLISPNPQTRPDICFLKSFILLKGPTLYKATYLNLNYSWWCNYYYPSGLGGSRTASSRMRRPLGSYSLQFSPKLMPALPPNCRHCSRSPCHRHNRCCPRHCTALSGVGVERLRTIAILQIFALLKLVVANLAHIVVAVRLIAMHLFKLTAKVIRIGNLLLVWIDNL